jgi:hypothetical protein
MRLTRALLDAVDLEPLRPYVANPTQFFGEREHYRLLALLSLHAGPARTIIDIGTHQGDSALALSLGGARVESFDLLDKTGEQGAPDNVDYNLCDLFDPKTRETWRSMLLESALILIDIDPHEGTRELEMVEWLHRNDYHGVIVLDDIWYFKAMRDNCWYRIRPCNRTDATMFGHWSGTGIVSFDKRVELENEPDTSNWTLVTGYFDLTKAPDANDALRARPATHYIDEHGRSTLSLDKNLVVFCDPELEEKIWKMRPAWLHQRTRVIPISFEDFPLTKCRDQIIENRGGQSGCSVDPRNTASYYLFCMARYAMLQRTLLENPFDSTHFAWINICIERMGFNNLVHLNEALSLNRDRFSTCWIDYISRDVVRDKSHYFGVGGCINCKASCSMCSGFFTGSEWYMGEACDRIVDEFRECLEQGYGHADEQLFLRVYFKHPELFDWYVGDYQQMITNYAGVYENPEAPIRNLIRNSLEAGDTEVCRRACDIVLRSHENGSYVLSPSEHETVLRYRYTEAPK